MKLGLYLEEQKLTAAEFGRRIGASRSAVIRWKSGKRFPDSTSMRAIIEATGGAVLANDFHGGAAAITAGREPAEQSSDESDNDDASPTRDCAPRSAAE